MDWSDDDKNRIRGTNLLLFSTVGWLADHPKITKVPHHGDIGSTQGLISFDSLPQTKVYFQLVIATSPLHQT
jgi:hypothetical protein